MERHRKQNDVTEFLFGEKECTANVHIRSKNRYVMAALDVNTLSLIVREKKKNEFSDRIRSGRPAAAMREDKAKQGIALITAGRRITSKLPNP